jgi:tetratricopeptide (TPR) repeat protein/TolB-like protein
MVSDGPNRQHENDREKLLSEIRRRAEEAELKRLEEEERAQIPPPSHPPVPVSGEEVAPPATPISPPPVSQVSAPPSPAEESPERIQRLAELFESAQSLYQQEHYEQSLLVIDDLLIIDPGHEEGLQLRQDVERAKRLADVIRKEEERFRATARETEQSPKPPPAPVRGPDETDFWGPTNVPKTEGAGGIPDAIETPLPRVPPKPPVLDRMVKQVSGVRIPVRPILTVAAVLLVAVLGYWVIRSMAQAVAPPQRVLVIFPAATSDGTGGMQHVADGMLADLIADLGGVQHLRVIAATTARASLRSTQQPGVVARTYHAGYYVTWKMIAINDRVEFDVSLFDTLSSGSLRHTVIESTIAELPVRRAGLAQYIVEALGIELEGQGSPLPVLSRGKTFEGYNSYLAARAALGSADSAALPRAFELLARSINDDSTYGPAWSALGWAHILQLERDPAEPLSHVTDALSCVQRAMNLDERRGETFRVWGMVELFNHDLGKATERLEEAVRLSPWDADALRRLAMVYVMRGRTEDGIRTAEEAVASDPANVESHIILGLLYQFRGDFRDAAARYEKAKRIGPEGSAAAEDLYADVLVYLQRADEALRVVTDRAARERKDPVVSYRLGRVLQAAGRPRQEWMNVFDRTRMLIGESLRSHPDSAVGLSLLALVYTRSGEFKEAIAASNRALALAPNDARVFYSAACLYALQRDKKLAIVNLTEAIECRYNLVRIVDMDLFNLRTDEEFLRALTR